MHHYRQVLVRLRRGDSDRDVARSGLMGRPKVAAFRALALSQGWLDPAAILPDDAALAAAVGRARRARSTISSVEPYRAVVERWLADGVSGVVIHAVLCREHGYRGSYSSVHRMVAALMHSRPPEATVRLQFAPGEAAQVDFGAGPLLVDPRSGHGLRHRYAQARYETLTGWRAPAAGGPSRQPLSPSQRALDAETRTLISQELGHNRMQITSIYCGR